MGFQNTNLPVHTIDDLSIEAEGEIIDPKIILKLEFQKNKPIFPPIKTSSSDEFLKMVHSSQKKWIILVDSRNKPRVVLEFDGFLRDALFNSDSFNPYSRCHRPIILYNRKTRLGDVIPRLKVNPIRHGDDVIDEDIIIIWSDEKRVITGSDILGRLLRGIVQSKTI
jgi:metal transporter CNNM